MRHSIKWRMVAFDHLWRVRTNDARLAGIKNPKLQMNFPSSVYYKGCDATNQPITINGNMQGVVNLVMTDAGGGKVEYEKSKDKPNQYQAKDIDNAHPILITNE